MSITLEKGKPVQRHPYTWISTTKTDVEQKV